MENFRTFTFSSAKISDDFFLVIDHKCPNFPPYFCTLSVHFPLFRENYYFPPTLKNSLPLFSRNSPAFYVLFMYFFPPYFDQDAFMHHPMHVLDASGHTYIVTCQSAADTKHPTLTLG